jgi:hypothetical protein
MSRGDGRIDLADRLLPPARFGPYSCRPSVSARAASILVSASRGKLNPRHSSERGGKKKPSLTDIHRRDDGGVDGYHPQREVEDRHGLKDTAQDAKRRPKFLGILGVSRSNLLRSIKQRVGPGSQTWLEL